MARHLRVSPVRGLAPACDQWGKRPRSHPFRAMCRPGRRVARVGRKDSHERQQHRLHGGERAHAAHPGRHPNRADYFSAGFAPRQTRRRSSRMRGPDASPRARYSLRDRFRFRFRFRGGRLAGPTLTVPPRPFAPRSPRAERRSDPSFDVESALAERRAGAVDKVHSSIGFAVDYMA